MTNTLKNFASFLTARSQDLLDVFHVPLFNFASLLSYSLLISLSFSFVITQQIWKGCNSTMYHLASCQISLFGLNIFFQFMFIFKLMSPLAFAVLTFFNIYGNIFNGQFKIWCYICVRMNLIWWFRSLWTAKDIRVSCA